MQLTLGVVTSLSLTCHIVVTHAYLTEEPVDARVFETCQFGEW